MNVCTTKQLDKPVNVPWGGKVQNPIRLSLGFEKKELAVYKLDAMAFCQFACAYCSSNTGNLMRINTNKIREWAREETGLALSPRDDADQFYMTYPEVVEALEWQLLQYPKLTRIQETLQFGMLVDNFSPELVRDKTTFRLLEILLRKTKFTIRILTKSSAVARDEFVELFLRYPNRVTVGLSCGSMNGDEIRHIEAFTTLPAYRAAAVSILQKSKISTFLMACPILPGFHSKDEVEELYSAFNPEKLDAAWCEPYNDRANWNILLEKYVNTNRKSELELIMTNKQEWSIYAIHLAQLHNKMLKKYGFKGRSYFLLYESGMPVEELRLAKKIPNVLFQSGTV